jgi:hypothetical protein
MIYKVSGYGYVGLEKRRKFRLWSAGTSEVVAAEEKPLGIVDPRMED